MLYVEIRIAKGHPAKDIVAGTISLDGDRLFATPSDSKFKPLLDNILADTIVVGGKPVKPSDGAKWIKNLYREYRSYALRATEAKERSRFAREYHADHDQSTHGNWANGDSVDKAALQKHLVDFKETRPLTGPGTKAISEIIKGAKSVRYMDMPGVERMHTLMGIPKPSLDTDQTEYMAARDRLFKQQTLKDVPFSEMVFTQQRVNLEELTKIPEEFQKKPVHVVKTGGKFYLMNGHHRVIGQFMNGGKTVSGHVLDLDDKRFHRTTYYHLAGTEHDHDQSSHAPNKGSSDSSAKASSTDPKVLESLARDIEKEFNFTQEANEIREQLRIGMQTKAMHLKPETVVTRRIDKGDHVEYVVDGEYTPERAARHEDIINGYLSQGESSETPTLLIMGGVSGSGKSSSRDNVREEIGLKNYVPIDADDIRAQLPEYQSAGGWNAALTQDETDDIALQVLYRARQEKKNVLFDSTMKTYDKFKKLIDVFREYGYRVTLAYVDAPLDKAMRNVVNRYRQTGRYVDLDYVASQDHKNRKSFEKLKDDADSAYLYDASGPKSVLKSVFKKKAA